MYVCVQTCKCVSTKSRKCVHTNIHTSMFVNAHIHIQMCTHANAIVSVYMHTQAPPPPTPIHTHIIHTHVQTCANTYVHQCDCLVLHLKIRIVDFLMSPTKVCDLPIHILRFVDNNNNVYRNNNLEKRLKILYSLASHHLHIHYTILNYLGQLFL